MRWSATFCKTGGGTHISTFMCLWAIYIFQQSDYLFYWRKIQYVDRSWEYINRSQTHECGNWDWGLAISFLGIHKWDFRCSVFNSNVSNCVVFQLHQAGDGHGNPEGGARALQGAQRHERRVRTGSNPENEYWICSVLGDFCSELGCCYITMAFATAVSQKGVPRITQLCDIMILLHDWYIIED